MHETFMCNISWNDIPKYSCAHITLHDFHCAVHYYGVRLSAPCYEFDWTSSGFCFHCLNFVQSWSDQHDTIQLNYAFSDIRLYHFVHMQSSVLLLSTFLSISPYIFIVPMQNVGSLISGPCHLGANDFCSSWQSWSYHCSKHTGKYVTIVGLV